MNLYDTSYVFDELRRGRALSGFVLDLALYEFTNVLWKYVVLLGKLKREEMLRLIDDLLEQDLKIIRVEQEHLKEIADLAVKTGLTAYDAAYIYYAKKLGLELKTLDKKVLRFWKR